VRLMFIARDVASSNVSAGLQRNNDLEIYLSLNPHPALTPVPDQSRPTTIEEQKENEAAYRQLLVRRVLTALLPEEDLKNDALRSLLEGIIGELILGQIISDKICQPEFMYEAIAKLVETLKEPSISANGKSSMRRRQAAIRSSRAAIIMWTILGYIFTFFSISQWILSTVFSHLPSRSPSISKAGFQLKNSKKGILDMRIWAIGPQLFEIPARQPWLAGSTSLLRFSLVNGPIGIAKFNHWLDR
jgi:hypothetical protein